MEESDEVEVTQLFQDIGFSSNNIVLIDEDNEKSNRRLQVMVNLIETKLLLNTR